MLPAGVTPISDETVTTGLAERIASVMAAAHRTYEQMIEFVTRRNTRDTLYSNCLELQVRPMEAMCGHIRTVKEVIRDGELEKGDAGEMRGR